MLHMPSPMLFGGAPQKTYSEFVAHITSLSPGGEVSWHNPTSLSGGAFRTQANGMVPGTMFGSTWTRWVSSYNPAGRMVQHGLSSEADYNNQVTFVRYIFYRLQARGNEDFFESIIRNGYESQGIVTTEASFMMTELIYWVGTDFNGYANKMQPNLGQGPVPYTW